MTNKPEKPYQLGDYKQIPTRELTPELMVSTVDGLKNSIRKQIEDAGHSPDDFEFLCVIKQLTKEITPFYFGDNPMIEPALVEPHISVAVKAVTKKEFYNVTREPRQLVKDANGNETIIGGDVYTLKDEYK